MDNVESRRKFLKKAAYVAPAVILLGSLDASAKSIGNPGNSKSGKGQPGIGNNGNSKLVGKGKKL
jgi:hypothetical protein